MTAALAFAAELAVACAAQDVIVAPVEMALRTGARAADKPLNNRAHRYGQTETRRHKLHRCEASSCGGADGPACSNFGKG
jgi:hypothetical protein